MAWHPIKHFRVITRHKIKVAQHCFKCGLIKQGLLHDMSKYSFTEFFMGAKYFLGTRSPNEAEREEKGYSSAWLHHKGRNKHHFEYWNDLNPETKVVEPVKMPLKYVVEMFCDRVAASKIYLGKKYTDDASIKYFEGGKGRRFIHKETSDFLEMLLRRLADDGEENTFAFIKHYLKTHKDY